MERMIVKVMKKKTKKIRTELVQEKIEVSICKGDYYFDVVAEGDESILWKLKKELEWETQVLKEGIFGRPLIVIDTCDDFSSAKTIFRDAIWKINKEIKKWK